MFTLLLFSLAILCPELTPGTAVASQQLEQKLRTHLEEYAVSKRDFVEALLKVAADFQIPIGIEWVRESGALREVQLSERDTTVRGLLDSLVKTQPGYALEFSNGVAHVFRRDLLTDQHNFLNLRIESFQVEDELGGMAIRRLGAIVKRTVSPRRQVSAGAGEGGSYAGPVAEKRITLGVENATVRHILNKLMLVSDFKVWVVTFSASPVQTPTGFRLTESIWNKNLIANNEQPVWETFMWGQKPRL